MFTKLCKFLLGQHKKPRISYEEIAIYSAGFLDGMRYAEEFHDSRSPNCKAFSE